MTHTVLASDAAGVSTHMVLRFQPGWELGLLEEDGVVFNNLLEEEEEILELLPELLGGEGAFSGEMGDADLASVPTGDENEWGGRDDELVMR